MSYFLGIDPGLEGAVAALDAQGRVTLLEDTPTILVAKAKGKKHTYLDSQMAALLRPFTMLKCPVIIALENVHAFPGQGVTSMFSLGTSLGLWRGIIAALGIPLEMVEPAKWKREMGIATGSDKAASIVRALQIFPGADLRLKKHHGRADSILLAEWLRRKHTQAPTG
jgi:hypothetical protein